MALTKSQEIQEKSRPARQDYPVAAGALTIYDGALVADNASGYLVPGADTVNFKFRGVSTQELIQLAGGSAGDNVVDVIPKGSGHWVKMKSATALDQADKDAQVFLVDDETVDTDATAQSIVVGVIRVVIDTEYCFVEI